jgi:hypothetical protein
LRDKGLVLSTIAKQLRCGVKRVAAALKQWHKDHALPAQDSRPPEDGDSGQAARGGFVAAVHAFFLDIGERTPVD